ncbi:terminase large subunit [Acinetobacter junii]|uniref:terminase large subunit n=1 Tax=Acinetobacter junii TaxID=40215 RepID=UPI00124C30A8|nr:terminase large subunit [Acinetobacter junii]MDA3507332.1 terminase large subunit [Acinetobacter junii]MDA3532002.1 terminase large subunit [Acinetobacter junii]
MSSMSPIWTTACPDWEKKILAKESLIAFEPLFPAEADMALRVFKELIVVDVNGKPTIGEITAQWVFDFVAAIFGALDYQSNQRLINEFFLLISKKNTKSTMAAGIMLTAIILNSREAAEFIIIAPTKKVADNSFTPLKNMIRADPELNALFSVSEHTRTITHRVTNAVLMVIAAETGSSAGAKGAFILVDELWVFGERANAESMLEEATGGMASFPEGFLIYLSTQSDKPPAGIFKKKLDYARKVRDGEIINPSFLPVLYEFPQEMIDDESYLKPEFFYVTNPNLGRSTHIRFLTNKYLQAQENGDESVQIFLAKYLNIEIGLNKRADRWAGADFWQLSAYKDKLFIESILDLSELCTVGFDGGGLDDLFGMAVIGRDKNDRSIWYCWNRAWAHPIVLQRRKDIAPTLQDFRDQGDLVIVENIGDDVRQAAQICKRIYDAGKFPERAAIGLDKLGMPSLQDGLLEQIPFELLIGVPQGYQLSGYVQTTERKVAEGKFLHAGQPMMNWCVGNAKGVYQGNAMTIRKQESGKAKIDPLIAMFNGVALMSMNPEPAAKKYSIYFA